jgi:predicted nucleic acid-binding protein
VKYFDTSYLVRLYVEDAGWQPVRAAAALDHVACCLHGKAESVSAFHRKFREGAISQAELGDLLEQFEDDCRDGAFQWLPLSDSVVAYLAKVYATLPRTIHVRAADAIHLACAAANALPEIYSHDTRLRDAARYFGLKGIDVI